MTDILTYDYDQSYSPSMPVIKVHLIAPESGRSGRSTMALIDSGSDSSMMPIDKLDEIEVLSVGTAVMSGIWGERRRVNTYLVTIQVGNYFIRGVRVAGVDADMDAILGRNVMNELRLVLNGPAGAVELPFNHDQL